jgi:hypothetical protein
MAKPENITYFITLIPVNIIPTGHLFHSQLKKGFTSEKALLG